MYLHLYVVLHFWCVLWINSFFHEQSGFFRNYRMGAMIISAVHCMHTSDHCLQSVFDYRFCHEVLYDKSHFCWKSRASFILVAGCTFRLA